MKYTQTEPCLECPFLATPRIKRAFTMSRLREFSSGEFPCHKSAEVVEDEEGFGEFIAKEDSVHCAGALIFLEKRNHSHQMMRIVERLGKYDRRKLNMAAHVR